MPDGLLVKSGRPKAAAVDETDTRPIIQVIPGELDRLATEAENALLDSSLPIFQRGRNIVTPIAREVSGSNGAPTISAALGNVSVPGLLDFYCQTARWRRFDARARGLVAADPPPTVATIHLARAGRWRFPVVAGVVTTPTLRPDGSLLARPGYDATTRLWVTRDPSLAMPWMVDEPHENDARDALHLLDDLLVGFPFISDADRAVALAGLITPVVRGAMQAVPLVAIRATAPGSGKSFLVDLAAAIATGRFCPTIANGRTEEETEKRLAGMLLEGFPIGSIDNCNGELGGEFLCQAVERPLVRIRRLGGSDITEVENRVTLFATGNGLRVRGDMVRRTILATLDANVERPELRSFGFDPVARVLEDRGRYVAAALTIVRAFILSGERPLPSIASFGAWSDAVRSALVWLGCADPCLTMETAREEDPELETLRQVVAVWHEHLGSAPCTVTDVADQADARHDAYAGRGDLMRPDLSEALVRVAGERGAISVRRLGYWLRGVEGRIVDGRKFVRTGFDRKKIALWAVQTCR